MHALFKRCHTYRTGRKLDLPVNENDTFFCPGGGGIAILKIDRAISDTKTNVCAQIIRNPNFAAAHRSLKSPLVCGQHIVVNFEQRPLIGCLDGVNRRQRLSRQGKRTAVLQPVKVDRTTFSGPQIILDGRLNRVARNGAGKHDGCVHASEHFGQ